MYFETKKIIQVVATASGISQEKILELKNAAAQIGLSIEMPFDSLIYDIPYHADSDKNRFLQLKNALLKNEDSIVWTLRGGYGSARLINALFELPLPKFQKKVIGFSDNTALHLFLSQHWGWKTIHGCGLAQLLNVQQDPQNFLRIAEIISGEVSSQWITHLVPMNPIACAMLRSDELLQGKLTGGNLTVLESGIGTSWQVDTVKKIVFLEDVGEKGYRIDRSLYHCYQAGLWQEVKAILLGEFSASVRDDTIPQALQRFADEMQVQRVPVYQTEAFGHGRKNYPLLYNAMARIISDATRKEGILEISI